MSIDQNPNNYTGATVTIVGNAASAPENPPYDKEGSRGIQQVRVAVSQGYKDKNSGEWKDTGTAWFTVSGRADDLAGIQKGDKVRVDDARLEAREFTRKDGSIGQAFETSFGTIQILESRGGGSSYDNSDSPF